MTVRGFKFLNGTGDTILFFSPTQATQLSSRQRHSLSAGSGLPDPNRDFNGVWNSHSNVKTQRRAPGLYLCPAALPPSLGRPAGDVERHSEEGSRLTQDFLEALTERMGLHYTNEATGMAATLPSFMPSQPAPFCREFAPYPVIAYSVFFCSLSFLFSALIPFALALKCTSAAHVCVHAPWAAHTTGET